MPTVAEVLKTAGFTDEQITGLDANAMKAFTGVLTAAEQERNQAELEKRAATQFYEDTITPALNDWGTKEANLSAERDYYKTLAEKAKDGGFVQDVPPFKGGEQQRGDGGKFVAGGNKVPGSPDFKEFESKVAGAMGSLSDIQWKHQSLYGKVMPDAPTALLAEANAARMPFADYVAKKYDYAGREAAIKNEQKQAERDAIVKETIAERDKYWTERGGSNPNVRAVETSRYADVKKAVAEGKREDPLKMSRDQRHAATAAAIRQDVASQQTA